MMLCEKALPENIKQLEATKNYIFGEKIDGERARIIKNGNTIEMINRRGFNIAQSFPEITEAIKNYEEEDNFTIDGEVVVFKNGKVDFPTLISRAHTTNPLKLKILLKHFPATYYAFDLLEIDGKNLRAEPLVKRLEALNAYLKELERLKQDTFKILETTDNGAELWKQVEEKDGEGIVAKLKTSSYEEKKRSSNWLKIKRNHTLDLEVKQVEITDKGGCVLICEQEHRITCNNILYQSIITRKLANGEKAMIEIEYLEQFNDSQRFRFPVLKKVVENE